MTENQVGFLFKLASSISQKENSTNSLLRSYFLMKCKDITKGYGLPDKHFSTKVRCPHCCTEWENKRVDVRTLRLSKKQRQRIRKSKITKQNESKIQQKKSLLNCNELVQICTLCKKPTVTPIPKPATIRTSKIQEEKVKATKTMEQKEIVKIANNNKLKAKNKTEEYKSKINVYSNTQEIFSLNNSNNTLPERIKKGKIIKNSKKKKDKFAGLCQKAVLASAKLKAEKNKQNKLDMFLKPAT